MRMLKMTDASFICSFIRSSAIRHSFIPHSKTKATQMKRFYVAAAEALFLNEAIKTSLGSDFELEVD